jgi:D-arabinose 5-phosphate isomerase GutQ
MKDFDDFINSGREIYIFGIGKSGLLGSLFSASLASIGVRSININPSSALHGDVGYLPADPQMSSALFISKSGEGIELIRIIEHLSLQGFETGLLTSNLSGTICSLVDYCWEIPIDGEGNPYDLPSNSLVNYVSFFYKTFNQIACQVALDVIVRSHPDGRIGRINTSLERSLREPTYPMFIELSDVTLDKIIISITENKEGVVYVKDGIALHSAVTDGDIRRLGITDDLLNLARNKRKLKFLKSSMSKHSSVLFMVEHHVRAIPVLNNENEIVGFVNIADIL